ncbi:MAG: hypothetical protein MZV70_48785 [Desulfobacterales bacterium]|nr:hypothetical protein [Desulfobacterales bacterium]
MELETMDLTIIVVNWNTRELLRKCLDSIETTVRCLSYEISRRGQRVNRRQRGHAAAKISTMCADRKQGEPRVRRRQQPGPPDHDGRDMRCC